MIIITRVWKFNSTICSIKFRRISFILYKVILFYVVYKKEILTDTRLGYLSHISNVVDKKEILPFRLC